jgi:hypothetical protein
MVWCLIAGHDDRMIRAPERLLLRCDRCGRGTSGWELSNRPVLQNERVDRRTKRQTIESGAPSPVRG